MVSDWRLYGRIAGKESFDKLDVVVKERKAEGKS